MGSRSKAINLMRALSGASCRCTQHGGGLHQHSTVSSSSPSQSQRQHTPGDTDYAFDVVQSNLSYGEGVTQVKPEYKVCCLSSLISYYLVPKGSRLKEL